jgi:hypothetical protein
MSIPIRLFQRIKLGFIFYCRLFIFKLVEAKELSLSRDTVS